MKKYLNVKTISVIAIFTALASILYCVPGLQFNLPFIAPSFMSIHLDEIPIMIAGFAYGPFVSIIILILKTLIKLPLSSSAFAGELGDFIFSLSLILPSTLIYNKNRTFKGAIIGISIGLILNLIFTTIINLYTIIPLYIKLYGMNEGTLASMFEALFKLNISSDKDIKIAILLLPFNLIKNAIVISVTLLIYKPLKYFIDRKK